MPPNDTTDQDESSALAVAQTRALVKLNYDAKLARMARSEEVELGKILEEIEEPLRLLLEMNITAEETKITSDAQEGRVAACDKPLRTGRDRTQALFRPREDRFNNPLKALRARKKTIIDTIEHIRKCAQAKCSQYLTERDARLAREREELQRKHEEQQRQVQEAAACEAEQRGDKAAAEQIRDMPVAVPPPPEPATPKVNGATVKVDYEYAVKQWSEFIRFVSLQPEHVIPTIVTLRPEWIKARLTQYGDTIQIPGIVVRKIRRRIGSR